MLDFLRSGAKDPGPKVLRKIADAERAAGLLPAVPPPQTVPDGIRHSSMHWKNRDDVFQSLETRLERLLEEAQSVIKELKELRERKG